MALDIATLFTRFGHIGGGLNQENVSVGSTLTSRIATVQGDYSGSDQNLIDTLYAQQDAARSSFDSLKSYWRSLFQATLGEMILDGTVYNPQGLAEQVQVLRLEMLAQSETIDDVAVTGTLTAGSGNIGNGTGPNSVLMAPYAVPNEYLLAETITITCTSDGYPGNSGTQGQEVFTIQGDVQYSNLAYNWPGGSAATGTITVFDPAVDGILSNASFDTWPTTTAAPTDWTSTVGTFNTSIVRSGTSYRGAYALTFVGQAVAENTNLRQTVSVDPNSVYSLQIQMRSDGSVAAGVIQISLINADTGTVINDNAGNALTLSVTCSALTSSYVAQKTTFFTPSVLPTNVAIQIRASTPITNTEVIYMDDLGFTLADQLYVGGPYLKLFAGATPFAEGDTFGLALTNARSSGTFASLLDNMFDLRTLGIRIPSGSSPTISNALIS